MYNITEHGRGMILRVYATAGGLSPDWSLLNASAYVIWSWLVMMCIEAGNELIEMLMVTYESDFSRLSIVHTMITAELVIAFVR